MILTLFPDFAARTSTERDLSLEQIRDLVLATSAPTKSALPWLKLARFGAVRTASGSLRHNANVLSITGIEGDYDGEIIGADEAAGILFGASVSALIYSSPSHTPEKPRWRVLCPLAQDAPPSMRHELIGRLNHVLGGVLSTESFTLSQAYYYGFPPGAQPETYIVAGRPIDTLDLPTRYPDRSRTEPLILPASVVGQSPDERTTAVLNAALGAFAGSPNRHDTIVATTMALAPYVLSGHLAADDVVAQISAACAASGRDPNHGEVSEALNGALPLAQRYVPANGEEFNELPPLPPAPPQRKLFPAPFELGDPAQLEPREWVYGRHYIRKFISATVAPGGLGKSSLALVEALDMVTGRGLLTDKPTPHRFKVFYWNGEDPIEETVKRVTAICLFYGITKEEIGGRLTLASGRDVPIRIATDTRDGFAIAEPLVDDLIAELREEHIDVLILDPFVKTHSINENDNNRVDAVASQFARIADLANVSVELVHHLRKANGTGQDRVAEDARGGVALISAARSVRVLNAMQKAEADQLGLPDDERERCFRVDNGKANLVPPRGSGDNATWRYLASVSLGNSRPARGLKADDIGVITQWFKPDVGDNVTPAHLAEIGRRFAAGGPDRRDIRSPQWAGLTVGEVLRIDLTGPAPRKRVGKIMDALIEGTTAFAGKPGLSAAHAVQVEAVLAEGVDVGMQQRRGAGEILVGNHVPLRTELRDDFADPQRVPDHHGIM